MKQEKNTGEFQIEKWEKIPTTKRIKFQLEKGKYFKSDLVNGRRRKATTITRRQKQMY